MVDMIIIIAAVCAVAVAVIILAVTFAKAKKKSSRKIVYVRDGVDIDSLKIMHETPFLPGTDIGTIPGVQDRQRRPGVQVEIVNLNSGSKTNCLIDEEIVIGRAPGEKVYRVNDPSVSSRHCSLCIRDDGLYIKDLNSLNHTYINNRQLERGASVKVPNECLVRVGKTELKITVR